MLVVDASVVVAACLAADGFARLRGEELVAPASVMSEACSALHEAQWRSELSPELARTALAALVRMPVQLRRPSPQAAFEVATILGWATTYDAEYVALARDRGCRLLTMDERLRRGAARLVDTLGPEELDAPVARRRGARR